MVAKGFGPRLSHDGSLIAYSAFNDITCEPEFLVARLSDMEQLVSVPGPLSQAEWSPVENVVAAGGYGSGESSVTLIFAEGSDPEVREIFSGPINGISWSGDGSRLAYVNGTTGEIGIYDLESLSTETLPSLQPPPPSAVADIAWSPAADVIAVWAYEYGSSEANIQHLYLVSPNGGAATKIVDPPGAALPSWSPDGTMLSFSAFEGNTEAGYIMPADGSAPARSFPGANGLWSPDSTLLTYNRGGCDTLTWDLAVVAPDGTGDRLLVAAAPDQVQLPLAWSPDSQLLVFSDKEHTYTVSRDGIRMTQLGAHLGHATWSPDGRYLIGQEVVGHGLC